MFVVHLSTKFMLKEFSFYFYTLVLYGAFQRNFLHVTNMLMVHKLTFSKHSHTGTLLPVASAQGQHSHRRS
jgi:hypothetical protein